MHMYWVRRVSAAVLLTAILAPGPAWAGDIYKPFKLLAQPFEAMHREKPDTCKDCSIEQLADQIDWLEHHIDTYGSIVAKHPDVWGESRLMRHRYEYEQQMAAQLDKFEVRMNAALRRSDQSFLGMAMALQAATGEASIPLIPSTSSTDATQNVFTQFNGMLSDPTATSGGPVTRSAPFGLPTGGTGFSFEQSELSLEPTIQLDQMSRYLNHLHELRRINEGDDIADSPGYALNLVRIPVSVLPGKQTRKGYGAEITITAEPYLTDELLPTTFRNLVINDVVDQLAYPMTRVVNSFDDPVKEKLQSIADHHFLVSTQPQLLTLPLKEAKKRFESSKDLLVRALLAKVIYREIMSSPNATAEMFAGVSDARSDLAAGNSIHFTSTGALAEPPASNPKILRQKFLEGYNAVQQNAFQEWRREPPETSGHAGMRSLHMMQQSEEPSADGATGEYKQAFDTGARVKQAGNDVTAAFAALKEQFSSDIVFTVPATSSRRARMPLPPSQLLAAYDLALLAHVAADAYVGLKSHPVDQRRLHQMDTRAFLVEETERAYNFLAREKYKHLWQYCGPVPPDQGLSLADALRTKNLPRIDRIRRQFLNAVSVSPGVEGLADGDTTRSLAWMVLVEAALLNDRLIQDIKEATDSKGCATCFADAQGLDFYYPEPSPEAITAFKDYVKCRWPIRVFALDPVTQDQNVADEFARRRELQVAAALAFASGQMNAQALMRFTRRLEWDMATIALNRTAIAFSHGNDTFGWRFQPRFQTPPTPGTLKAFSETLLGGPTRDADMCQRELESGIRECTAIVVMPSFVPYATFDVRTNWYRLTDPKCTEISMRETMELSRAITAMKNSAAQCSRCAHLYREGEVDRLLRRVDQLDHELPLQTMQVQIPYENTSGGFEIFNRGITELAPELIGWYGAPGIDRNIATTMFLVGDGFSVHDTQVIAGGRPVPFQLISRQLMKVQIPVGAQTLTRGRSVPGGEFNPRELEEVVDVHLATPYGVSSHLLVPVAEVVAAPVTHHFQMRPEAKFTLLYEYEESDDEKEATVNSFFMFNQNAVVIHAPRIAEVKETETITFSLTDASEKTYLGSFQMKDIPFNAYAYEYYITADKLKSLVGGTNMLADVVEPYLVYKGGKATITVEVTATVSATNIPVAGGFTAVCKPSE